MVVIRGIEFQANTDNTMGLEFYNLSHRFGFQNPNKLLSHCFPIGQGSLPHHFFKVGIENGL